MRETTVLCEVVCGAEPAEAPNWADFALRCDDELCAHDGESQIGVLMLLSPVDALVMRGGVGYTAVTGGAPAAYQ